MVKTAVLLAIRMYKRLLSPMLPAACRYVPTCSEYAEEAIERYGVLRGSLKAVCRLLRCHPLAHGGFDPVHCVQACDSVKHELLGQPWVTPTSSPK
ncbi:MAG TPA: membrane protein insertion efficiency factor YidD [Terriglobales bacterium]|nr:membrane protein insertion efficiency factor YidD [Terriglobales bacterium]